MGYGMGVDQERNKIWSLAWRGDTHTFKPSTQEAETGRFLSSRPAWTEQVPGQPGLGLHWETLS